MSNLLEKMDKYEGEREYLTYSRIEDMFEECINETHDPVEVCGCTYEAGRVLREMDPVAFRCGVSDWLDSEIQDGNIHEDEEGDFYV